MSGPVASATLFPFNRGKIQSRTPHSSRAGRGRRPHGLQGDSLPWFVCLVNGLPESGNVRQGRVEPSTQKCDYVLDAPAA